jgi:hypothetical protein
MKESTLSALAVAISLCGVKIRSINNINRDLPLPPLADLHRPAANLDWYAIRKCLKLEDRFDKS